jgi:putative redox protein
MTTITTVYEGNLRTIAQHVISGDKIITDAPVDNQGRGEAFSPTDLLATSLGSCMLTIMGIAAKNHEFSIDGTRIDITKVMGANPRKVSEIIVEFHFPSNSFSDSQKRILEKAATTCPVALSLHPDLNQKIIFNW